MFRYMIKLENGLMITTNPCKEEEAQKKALDYAFIHRTKIIGIEKQLPLNRYI